MYGDASIKVWPEKRGPKTKITAATLDYQKLQRENERLTDQLRKAEIVIDIQKKVASVAGPAVPANGDAVMTGLGELIPVVGVKKAHQPRASPSSGLEPFGCARLFPPGRRGASVHLAARNLR